ncbi:MAG TPA: CocE/NonD family hydrolase, partial [Thermomicrobiaceae bacterium]|nr:CocE/NonD family hydrolase [Thermomicrobiaceae bacterium]
MSRRQLGLLARVLGTPALLALSSLAGTPRPAERAADAATVGDSDAAWWDGTPSCRTHYAGVVSSSRYLTMRDGVRLAVELYLPAGLPPGERIPAILFQTRYVRAFTLRWPFERLLPNLPAPLGTTYRTMRRFVTSGYAWVAVDVRGSGASFGHRRQEWSPEEIADGVEIADWIVRQPWSDGSIGATGISYEGIAAEFLAGSGHPAIKAVAPRFALFDAYAEAGFPGGIHHTWFTERWSRLNQALDGHRFTEVAGWPARLLGIGVRPVEPDNALLQQAIEEHAANYDLHQEARGITFRDDRAANGLSVDAMSPWRRAGALQASGMPVYS